MGKLLQFPKIPGADERIAFNSREGLLLSWLRVIMEDGTHWEMAFDIMWTQAHECYDEEEMERLEEALGSPMDIVSHECLCEDCIEHGS